jgi:hypothetical protein
MFHSFKLEIVQTAVSYLSRIDLPFVSVLNTELVARTNNLVRTIY